MTTTATDSETEAATNPKARISAEGVYGEIVNFLIDEYTLLDHDQFHEWLELVTDDIEYKLPRRETRYRRDGRGFDENQSDFNDSKMTLGLRVRRNSDVSTALDRDPAPRIRRFVSNVVVHEGDAENEYAVNSAFLLLRSRFRSSEMDMLSGERVDVIRRTPDGLRLARRTIYLDQSGLGSVFSSVFV